MRGDDTHTRVVIILIQSSLLFLSQRNELLKPQRKLRTKKYE